MPRHLPYRCLTSHIVDDLLEVMKINPQTCFNVGGCAMNHSIYENSLGGVDDDSALLMKMLVLVQNMCRQPNFMRFARLICMIVKDCFG